MIGPLVSELPYVTCVAIAKKKINKKKEIGADLIIWGHSIAGRPRPW